jgi:hypothetical protein
MKAQSRPVAVVICLMATRIRRWLARLLDRILLHGPFG